MHCPWRQVLEAFKMLHFLNFVLFFMILMNLKMLLNLKAFRNGTKVCGVTSCGGDR